MTDNTYLETGKSRANILLAEYDMGCQGRADVDMRGILHDIIDDIRLSYDLAITGAFKDAWTSPEDIVSIVNNTMDDYIANNYGDD